jgi:triacylglycerol lipase
MATADRERIDVSQVCAPSGSIGVARQRPWWGHPVREYAWQVELLTLLANPIWRGVGVPMGDGTPVLMVPGFLAGDPSFVVMRSWLRRCGYRTYQAGIKWNVDCANRSVDRLAGRVSDVAERTGQPVHLVAHSRGGLLARALGRRRPENIAQIITLGSPLRGEFDCAVPVAAAVAGVRAIHNVMRSDARDQGCFTHICRCGYSDDLAGAFTTQVPLTSIYTMDDGIVRPSACVVPDAVCIAVRGTHLGLVTNAAVYRELGQLLARATHASG